ncbi:MAG: glycosyl transferase family 1, partial [Bacteroidota bacterium]|nr:glycosyl transferase family 1 [Bacteroidota bacterium]
MKRVLIITYYWPPSGGAGVQRWLKFVKYLRNFKWEPIVFTVENGEFPVLDFDLIKEVPDGVEVLKVPAWEPYKMYKLFSGKNKSDGINSGFLSEKKGSSFIESISKWIRGNLF